MKIVRFFVIVILVLALLTGVALFIGLIQKDKSPQRTFVIPETKPYTGVSLSPASYDAKDFTTFFETATNSEDIVSYQGDWQDLQDESSGAYVVAGLAETYNYTPLIAVSAFSTEDGSLLRPLTKETKDSYLQSTQSFLEEYPVPYFGIGVETNTLYETSETDYQEFVDLFQEASMVAKKASPETKIFISFQLEKMKGLKGGLFGGVNDESQATWELIDDFPSSNIISFTTYPNIVYDNPEELTKNYYSEIREHTDKPIAFNEIGWPGNYAEIPGHTSTEAEQKAFIELFGELQKPLDTEFMIWSFLYDQTTVPFAFFESMGLIDIEGREKPAFSSWKSLKE